MLIQMLIHELRNRGYDVEETVVSKNGVRKTGILFKEEGFLSPVIYPPSKRTLLEIVDEVERLYLKAKEDQGEFLPEEMLDWARVKDSIICCFGKDDEESLVSKRFLNGRMFVRIILSNEYETIKSVKVTKPILQALKVDEKTLFSYAIKNSINLIKIYSLDAMMDNVMMGNPMDDIPDLSEEEFSSAGIIVVSNRINYCGASVLGNIPFMTELAQKMDLNELVILPSSIHEFLVVNTKIMPPVKYEDLRTMVKEINQEQVVPEEQLSDSIYIFHTDTEEYEII